MAERNEGMKLNAEWIPHMKAYRLYAPRNPQQTIAYEDDEETAESTLSKTVMTAS